MANIIHFLLSIPQEKYGASIIQTFQLQSINYWFYTNFRGKVKKGYLNSFYGKCSQTLKSAGTF